MTSTYIIYNSILIFSTLFVFLYEKTRGKFLSKIFLSIAFLIVYIPAAIRYNIGQDYWSYVEIYDNYKLGIVEKELEFGFEALVACLNYFDLPSHSLFVVSNFIMYFVVFLSYPKKGASVYHFAYIVFCYFGSYNLIRNYLALSFCLLFLKLLIEHKSKILQFIVLLLAFSFHKTTILIIFPLILYWLGIAKLFKYKFSFLLFFILVITLFVFKDQFVNIIVSSGIVTMLGYGNYLDSDYFQTTEIGSGLGILLKITILMIAIYYYQKIDSKYRNIILVYCIALIFSIIMRSSIQIFSRIETFYTFAFVFAVFGLYITQKFRLRQIVILFAISYCLLIFENNITRSKSDVCAGHRISPYVSIFNKKDDNSWSGIRHNECINW